MEYCAPLFDSSENIDLSLAPDAKINSFHWEKPGYSRPESHAHIFGVLNSGIHAVLYSFEENIRCECAERDDPVYTDSCLELFLMPVPNDKRYINFEVNPKGVYLSQIGVSRENRRFISELTSREPIIMPMEIEEDGKKGWGYEIIIDDKLISDLFSIEYHTVENTIRGNFYKCADLSISPHFAAFFPVSDPAAGFHNPERFGAFTFRKV